jgi:hypothetical protein
MSLQAVKGKTSNFRKWTNDTGMSMKTKDRLAAARHKAGM